MDALEVIFDSNPAVTTESIYVVVKKLAESERLKTENVEALAELITELANRMKEGEFSGK